MEVRHVQMAPGSFGQGVFGLPATAPAFAEDYPTRPITMIVRFGGRSDQDAGWGSW